MQPVSIVATVLNEIDDIARVVQTLLAQQPPPAQVIVVDGGSSDGTWEWLAEAGRLHPNFLPIRDETCSLKHSLGPVSRGRNVAIAAASQPLIACADAGCTYGPDWLRNLTAPLVAGQAQYAVGGSCLDLADPTLWDLASASFFSIKLSANEPTKSCTARSMAFTKDLWQRIGGFPESVLVGEDTLFDFEARRLAAPAFVPNAKALYRPQYTFRSACHNLARYALSDGMAGVRHSRIMRNALRCGLQLAALAALPWTVVPLVVILAMQCWFAFRGDFRHLVRFGPVALLARFAFSVAVPWVIAVNQVRGAFRKEPQTNRQNLNR